MANVVQPSMLRETERVAVWECSLEPGEEMAEHDHEFGYVVVVLEGESLRIEEPDGELREVDVYPGEVLVGGARPPHKVINTGRGVYREILVELM